jgi:hypothetical protein
MILTAAHVLTDPAITVRFKDGVETSVDVVRIARGSDVALLRTHRPIAGYGCLPLRADPAQVGNEVYAAGSPRGLEFTLTRGIVSGYREVDGRSWLQTDAPINPGNSGGPLGDADGNVLGVVQSKIMANKTEGLAFALPTKNALQALNLAIASETSPILATEVAVNQARKIDAIVDTEDAVPSLDPEGDRRAELAKKAQEAWQLQQKKRQQQAKANQDYADMVSRMTPWYVPATRWGGVGLFVVGAAGVVTTFVLAKQSSTMQADWVVDTRWNTVSWIAGGVGVAAFVSSFLLMPKIPPRETTAGVQLDVGLGSLGVSGRF